MNTTIASRRALPATILLSALLAPIALSQPTGPGRALDCGSSGYVTVTTGTIPSSGNFTVECWAQAPGNSGFNTIIGQGTGTGFYICNNSTNNTVSLGDDWVVTGIAFPFGSTWHHFALVKATTSASFYLDGVLVTNRATTIPNPNVTEMRFGSWPFGTMQSAHGVGGYWQGKIDEIRIWNAARTLTQITNNMHRPLVGNEMNLVSYWRFDEGSGSSTFDVLGGFGSLVSSPSWILSPVLFVPGVITSNASNVTATSATLKGTVYINPNTGPNWAWFDWGTTINYGNQTPITVAGSGGPFTSISNLFSVNLSNLAPFQVYHFRLAGSNIAGLTFGTNRTFVTLSTNADLAALTTTAGPLNPVFDSNLTNYSTPAVLNTVTNVNVTATRVVNAGTMQVRVNGGNSTTVGSGFPSSALALDVGANTIELLVTAQDGSMKTYTLSVDRLPPPPQPPTVTTLPATGIFSSSATLNGTINPNGQTTYAWFEYGTDTSYGSSNPPISLSGTNALTNSVIVSGLLPNTVYHYRVAASNSTGFTFGLDSQFQTTVPLAVNPVAATLVSNVNGGVGFSFVPAYNLQVTNIAYLSKPYSDPIVSFWSGTNLIGRKDFVIDSGTNFEVVSGAFSLGLLAGQPYSVTFQDGALLTSTVSVAVSYSNQFTVASELTNYAGFKVTPGGAFTNFASNTFYLGATFIFQVVPVLGSNADLVSLVFNTGVLTPAFTNAVSNYSMTLPNGTSNLTVTATAADAASTIKMYLNGVLHDTLPSGIASLPLPLIAGTNTLQVAVTASDTVTTKTNTINVNRLPPPPQPPTVTTLPATGIFSSSATLNGTINPNGQTTYAWFEYGTDSSYGSTNPPVSLLGTNALTNSAIVSGLLPNTVYHYRVVASNSSGFTFGLDSQFQTTVPLAVNPVAATLVSNVNGGVGFSFVPAYNLQVTDIAYLSKPYSDPIVSFWSGTNLIGRKDFVIDSGANFEVVSGAFSLGLLAGQPYSVTFQDGALLTSTVSVAVSYSNQFTVASELTNYAGFKVTPGGAFTNFASDTFYLGATFIFQVVPVLGSNVDLVSLVFNTGVLTPAFTNAVSNYSMTLPNSTSNLTVTATAADAASTIKVYLNGVLRDTLPSGIVSLPLPLIAGTNTLQVAVTASDTVTTKTNTINVTRAGPAPPTVTTQTADQLTSTNARLNGLVNPNGTSAGAYFEWGLTTNYGQSTLPVSLGSGSAPLAVSGSISNLVPATAYHFRVAATNAVGLSLGADQIFTSLSTNAYLASLTSSGGALTPMFDPHTLTYRQTLAGGSIVMLTPTVADPNATLQMRVNGASWTPILSGAASAPLVLNSGLNQADILVTAQDGLTTKTYTNRITLSPPPPQIRQVWNGTDIGPFTRPFSNVALSPGGESGSQVFAGKGNLVYAFDNTTGTRNWTFTATDTVNRPIATRLHSGTEAVFVTAQDGSVNGINAQNGAALWSAKDTKRKSGIGTTLCAADGIVAPPAIQRYDDSNAAFRAAIQDDLVIVCTSYDDNCNSGYTYNRIYGFKASTGATAWTFNLFGHQVDFFYGACTIDSANNVLYAASNQPNGSGQHSLWQISTLDGTLIASQNYGAIRSKPVLDGDRLYVANYDGTLFAISTNLLTEIWSYQVTGSETHVNVEPVVFRHCGDSQNIVLVSDSSGYLHGLRDIGTNNQVAWPTLYVGVAAPVAAPVVSAALEKAYVAEITAGSDSRVVQIDVGFGHIEARLELGQDPVAGLILDSSGPSSDLRVDRLTLTTPTKIEKVVIPWPAGTFDMANPGVVTSDKLRITKSVSPRVAILGQPITYTLLVTNLDDTAFMTDVLVTDLLPIGVTNAMAAASQGAVGILSTDSCVDLISYLADSGVVEVPTSGYQVRASVGILTNRTSATVTITTTPTQVGFLTNTAYVLSDQTSSSSTNCNATVVVQVLDPAADEDGDGVSNLQEYLAGTDPLNSASSFRIVSLARQTNGLSISWTTVGGRKYELQAAADPSANPQTGGFLAVSPIIVIPGNGEALTNFVEIGAATNSPRYYRVKLVP